MMVSIAFPWLLADIPELFGAALFVMMVIGWIVNLVNQNQPGNPPRRPQTNRPRSDQVQNEIDRFLNQARRPQNKPQSANVDDVELAEEGRSRPPRRPPPANQRRRTRKEVWEEQTGKKNKPGGRPKPAPPAKPAVAANLPSAERPGQSLAQRHVQTSVSGSSITRDVGHLPTDRVGGAISRNEIKQSVTQHLGAFSAADDKSSGAVAMASTTSSRATPAEALRQLMKTKHGVRDAIVLSEILSKPRALRRPT